MSSGLYGIKHTNRADTKHFTKNCFNSSFPTALACYMMEKDIPAIYVKLAVVDGELKVVCDEISIRELFNCGDLNSSDLEFDFEYKYKPYQKYAFDDIDSIDLVVKDLNGNYLAPVEVKLTVLPTSATASKPENKWGCEIVVRSATTSYCALQIWDSVKDNHRHIRDIFESTCSGIGSWTNDFEMFHKTSQLCQALDTFEKEYCDYQRPLVMEPFWNTQGQSPVLCDNAFDIVIWSDLAFSRLFIDSAKAPSRKASKQQSMSRQMRAASRMARCLWELSKSGKINIEEIYRQIAFNNQTDKELSIPGAKWRRYVTSDRVINPSIPKTALEEIVESKYIEKLMPERRFDQTLYISSLTMKK